MRTHGTAGDNTTPLIADGAAPAQGADPRQLLTAARSGGVRAAGAASVCGMSDAVVPFVARPPGALADAVAPASAPDASRAPQSSPTRQASQALHGAHASRAPRASTTVVVAASAQSLSAPARAEFGPLAGFIAEPGVTDVLVNGAGELWVDRGSGLQRHPLEVDESSLRELAVHLVSLGGRHIDESSPIVDARLADGIRVHAVLPPISLTGTLLSIRLPSARGLSLDDLGAAGFFGRVQVAEVRELVARRTNVLITGAAGSGKTTLLAALLGEAGVTERIIAIEDVAELRPRHPHFVSLEARQPNLEGAGGLGLARLLREALRMRPDRLVLGECRGEEIRELLSALNTGHDGGGGTLHANSLDDVPARLEALGALAGLDGTAVARQAVSAFGAVLHLERVGGLRRLAGVATLALDATGRLAVSG